MFVSASSQTEIDIIIRDLNRVEEAPLVSKNLLNIHTDVQKVAGLIQKYRTPYSSNPFSAFAEYAIDYFKDLFCFSGQCKRQVISDEIEDLQKRVDRVYYSLKPYDEDIRAQKKWLELGLPKKMIEVTPELVRKLVLSGQVFSMVGFSRGKKEKQAILEKEGAFEILFQGKYIPVSEFDYKIDFDPRKKLLFVQGVVFYEKQWITYVAPPKGFIHFDTLDSSDIQPIEELTQEELRALKIHAAQQGNQDPEKVYAAFQICTRVGPTSGIGKIPDWLLHENEENIPPHYFFRIIDSVGKVYSLGFTAELIRNMSNLAAIQPAKIVQIDSCEFRKRALFVTTLPIMSKEHLEKIFETVEARADLYFQTLSHNCTTFLANILTTFGIVVPIQSSIETVTWNAIQKPLLSLSYVNAIAQGFYIAGNFIQKMSTFVPSQIQEGSLSLYRIIENISKVAFGVIKMGCMVVLGGSNIDPQLRHCTHIKPFLHSWKQWFDPHATDIDDSVKLLAWQKNNPLVTEKFDDDSIPYFHVLKKIE